MAKKSSAVKCNPISVSFMGLFKLFYVYEFIIRTNLKSSMNLFGDPPLEQAIDRRSLQISRRRITRETFQRICLCVFRGPDLRSPQKQNAPPTPD